MKRNISIAFFMFFVAIQLFAQTVTDIDGNVYKTIVIGSQTWIAENLRTKHYRNGKAIQDVTDNATWAGLSTSAYCNYNNDTTKTTLYNWFAVSDTQNIAPEGWHVAGYAEWETLAASVGGNSIAGSTLESKGFATTGSRNANGGFEYPNYGDWWTSTQEDLVKGKHRAHQTGVAALYDFPFNKKYGFAVRCVKDDATEIENRDFESKIQIFPNPAHEKLNFLFDPLLKGNINIELTDIYGKQLFSSNTKDVNSFFIDMAGKSQGFYLVTISSGNQKYMRKICLRN